MRQEGTECQAKVLGPGGGRAESEQGRDPPLPRGALGKTSRGGGPGGSPRVTRETSEHTEAEDMGSLS